MVVSKENRLETPEYLEDVPHYAEKLAAWKYLNNPERAAIYAKLLADNKDRATNAQGRADAINRRFGFPRADLSPNGNLAFVDAPKLQEYCKDILGKDGQPLISKNVFKEAA